MTTSQAEARDVADEAANVFVRRLHGPWSADDQAALDVRLAQDRDFADAFQRVVQSWSALDQHAEVPEVMAYREHALAEARRANSRRWRLPNRALRLRLVGMAAAVLLVMGVVLQLSPLGYRPGLYHTDIGEQRVVELPDRSRLAIDSSTRLRVRYSDGARVVELLEGQVQFTVAKDPLRPFKVVVGDRSIVALGTVFTVDYADDQVNLAMLEGRVAIVDPGSEMFVDAAGPAAPVSSGAAPAVPVEVVAGEAWKVDRHGRAMLIPEADIEAATAWRQGKVILRAETLSEAVRRMNRYSHRQLVVEDESLGAMRLSGVFEVGDSERFLQALELYLPIVTDYSDSGVVRIKAR